jgi:hypothetical protein
LAAGQPQAPVANNQWGQPQMQNGYI